MGKVSGERAGNRTPNLVVKSHLLCQLSYAPGRKLEARGFEIKAESDPITVPAGSSIRRTESASARRLDPEFVADTQRDFGPPRKALGLRFPVSPNTVSALRAGPAALQPKGRTNASLRHQRDHDGPQK